MGLAWSGSQSGDDSCQVVASIYDQFMRIQPSQRQAMIQMLTTTMMIRQAQGASSDGFVLSETLNRSMVTNTASSDVTFGWTFQVVCMTALAVVVALAGTWTIF